MSTKQAKLALSEGAKCRIDPRIIVHDICTVEVCPFHSSQNRRTSEGCALPSSINTVPHEELFKFIVDNGNISKSTLAAETRKLQSMARDYNYAHSTPRYPKTRCVKCGYPTKSCSTLSICSERMDAVDRIVLDDHVAALTKSQVWQAIIDDKASFLPMVEQRSLRQLILSSDTKATK